MPADEPRTGPDIRRLVDEATEDLRKIRSARDVLEERPASPNRWSRPAMRSWPVSWPRLAYAPHLGDPDGPELLAGDPSARHDFGFDDLFRDVRVVSPWRRPQRLVGVAGGWRAAGSMLGLDVGLAVLSIRRLETDGLPPPPGGNDIDRAALAAAVALSNPFDVSDVERDTLTDAIRRGRARLSGVDAHPEALAAVTRAAGLDEWRRQALGVGAGARARPDRRVFLPGRPRADRRGGDDALAAARWVGRLTNGHGRVSVPALSRDRRPPDVRGPDGDGAGGRAVRRPAAPGGRGARATRPSRAVVPLHAGAGHPGRAGRLSAGVY